jgi:hypothetical protein
VTEPQSDPPSEAPAVPPAPTLAQRLTAYTFLGAFGLTILTVILTGLWVRSPMARRVPETTAVTLTLDQPRTVNLLFKSRTALDAVQFIVELPPGIELDGHPGLRRVVWKTPLAAGNNLLPMELVARAGPGGALAARLRHGEDQKTFVVDLVVAPH